MRATLERGRPGPDGRPARTLGRGRKIVFALIVLAIGAVLCETAVRVRAWLRYGSTQAGVVDELLIFDPDLGIQRPRPGYRVLGQKIAIEINSLGFRGEEIAPRKGAQTLRIACVGASTTFCADVSNDRATWPHRLQESLQSRYPGVKVEVINAGVPGFMVSDSLKNLEQRVLPLEPDLVIYYEANNDMAHDTQDLARRQGLLAPQGLPVPPGVAWLSRYSLLVDLTYKNGRILLGRTDQPAGKLTTIPSTLPRRFISEIDRMRQVLDARQVPLVLSTFLVKYRRNQDRPTQIANASVAFYYMPWMTIDGLLDGTDRYNEAILQYGRSHGIPVVDDRDAVPATDKHFVDWSHLTDAGCVVMADRFRRFLHERDVVAEIIRKKGLGP